MHRLIILTRFFSGQNKDFLAISGSFLVHAIFMFDRWYIQLTG